VTTIGFDAFKENSLTSVVIGASVNIFDNLTTMGNTGFKTVYEAGDPGKLAGIYNYIDGEWTILAVGDSYGGGIVAYIDGTGQHGLIAATADQDDGSGIVWAMATYQTIAVPDGTSTAYGEGENNTNKIIDQNGEGSTYAAGLARAHDGGGYHDWFLPSLDELYKLYDNRAAIDSAAIASFVADNLYWSSSEVPAIAANAWGQNITNNSSAQSTKGSPRRVRAVRAF